MTTCEDCGREVRVGDWPYCPHGYALDGGLFAYTFTPYFDEHLVSEDHPRAQPVMIDGALTHAVEIRSPGDRKQLMKEGKWELHAPKIGMPGCEV
jgi:hypothetical protein